MQRTPHFFKIRTRLGLTHPPVGKSEPNIGVEDGSDAVLSADFLTQFPGAKTSEFTFSKPEDVAEKDIWRVTADESKKCIDLIQKEYVAAETLVTVGGDHSMSFCTILALLERHDPSTLAYIQIDSHGDINNLSQSPTGNWHGMYLRPVFGDDFDVSEITALVKKKIPTENLLYLGNLELDGDEPAFFNKHTIQNITVTDIRASCEESMQRIEKLLEHKTHLHINIDIDAFDESAAPATGLPKQGGLLIDDLSVFFDLAKTLPSLSVDLVEVNPHKDGAEKTISLAQNILTALMV